MKGLKGTLALDIDGTITVQHRILDKKVKTYLEHLCKQGWALLFVTGRTFSFAEPILQGFEAPFSLAVQNGAALYQMPGELIQAKHYLSVSSIPRFRDLLRAHGVGLLIESGRPNRDLCYYCPEDFSEEEKEYLSFRMSISPEKWEKVESSFKVPLQEFAVGKFFAKKEVASQLAEAISSNGQFNVIVIRDPFRPGFHLALINEKGASKGTIIDELPTMQKPLIVAGDDYNDLAMLKKGDIKIVMGNAPQELHAVGDIVAPPAAENGIIAGLEEALKRGEYARENPHSGL